MHPRAPLATHCRIVTIEEIVAFELQLSAVQIRVLFTDVQLQLVIGLTEQQQLVVSPGSSSSSSRLRSGS